MTQSLGSPVLLRSALALTVGFVLLGAPAASLGAQSAGTVSPGMSREEVVRALGTPTGERSSRGYTYLFFANGCERTCGTSDVVTLEDGRVSDAIFRKPGREYTGHSSSPSATAPSATAVGATSPVRVAPRRAGARPAGRAARRAVTTRPAITAAEARGQTRELMVAPRRAPPADTDSTVARRELADTTTSTGTRFGPPLTIAPGPRTPQTPGLGAPPSRDSTVRNGVPLPPGSVPVPFQGARPSSVDSARAANARQRTPPSPAQPARTPR